MSDYIQTTDFGDKDALGTGNPAKVVRGTELDVEFAAIAAAIATKYDAGDTGSFGTLTVTSASVPTNGFNLPSSNTVGIATNSAVRVTIGPTGALTVTTTGGATSGSFSGVNEIVRLTTSTARGSGGAYLSIFDPTGVKAQLGYAAANDVLYLSNELNADMYLRTNGTLRVTVSSLGRVEIATPASGTALTVNGVASGSAQSWSDGTHTAWLNFGSSSVRFGSTTAAPLKLNVNASDIMTLISSGEVGINCTPPAGASLRIQGAGFNDVGLEWVRTGANDGVIQSYSRAASAYKNLFIDAAYTELRIGASTAITIGASRNVTISAPASGTALAVTGVSGGVALSATDGTGTTRLQYSSGVTEFGSFSAHRLDLVSNSSVRARLNTSNSNSMEAVDDGGSFQVVGWRDAPQTVQDTTYSFALADRGKNVHHTSGSAHTWTIPANASVAFPVGTLIVLTNSGAGAVTVAITTDTLTLAGAGTTGSRTLAQHGVATLVKTSSTGWYISGTGVT